MPERSYYIFLEGEDESVSIFSLLFKIRVFIFYLMSKIDRQIF